ncbi:hypothetical protein CK203_072911 [Vitis vinifera]|uniref:Uncharacterized protein n=1 Tax=Vitis vinifera TaxID=29760 RepID=A0A438F1W1_VITVI|nr:hypothetical protein CK203_072911 [Vitis vinifera]
MHPPMVLLAMASVGASSPYEWLSETMVMGMWVMAACCDSVLSDIYALPASFALPWIGEAETNLSSSELHLSLTTVCLAFVGALGVNIGVESRFWFNFGLKMSSKKKAASSARVSDAHEKSTDKLSVKEFRDRFCIPNGVIVDFLHGEDVVPTEKAEQGVVVFFQGTIQCGAPVPPASVAHGIPPFHQDSTRPYSSQYYPGADGMQHHQHAPVRAPAFPSIGDGTARLDEGRGKGTGDGPGCVGGVEASDEALFSKLFLSDSGSRKKGATSWIGWKGRLLPVSASYFEIDAKERQCKTLLTARNLMAVVREAPRDLPIYEALKEADAEKRRTLLDNRERRKNEGTLRKAPGQKRDADSSPKKTPAKRRKLVKNGKGVKEPSPPMEFASSAHYSRGGAVARPANLAEEAASINHPDSPTPGVDAVEAVCADPMEEAGAESQSQPSDDPDRLALVLVTGPPSKRPRSVRNLRSGLIGRLQERQQEIEVSCSSAHDAHPEGGEVEMVTEIPAVRWWSRLRLHPGSYAELEDKLKQIPPGSPDIMPSAQMFEKVETAKSREESTADRLHEAADEMAGLRGEVRQLRTESFYRKETDGRFAAVLVAQKEELEQEFVVEREELEAEYKKQVDDTFIFGYRCCMKKNGIKRDVPSIPPGEEKKLHDKTAP